MKTKQFYLRGFVFLFFIVFILFSLNHILLRKDWEQKFYDFNTMKRKDFDVLFMGTSHLYKSIIPMELWKDHGITSYNMAIESCTIPTEYWMLKNALQYSHPKVVVLEPSIYNNTKADSQFIHSFFDSIPLNKIKCDAAFDLFNGNLKKITEILLPFSLYHGRWKEISLKNGYSFNSSKLMGYVPCYGLEYREITKQASDSPVSVENVSTVYIQKIIDLCTENDIKVMFLGLPFHISTESIHDKLAFVPELAGKNDIYYLSGDEVLEYLDPSTDYNDHTGDNSHTNFSGASKVTHIVGEKLKEHYDLPDHRNDPQFSDWNTYTDEYNEFKRNALYQSMDITTYLTKCYDDDYLYFIEFYGNKVSENKTTINQLKNIGVDFREPLPDTSSLYVIHDHQTILYVRDFLSPNMDFSDQTEIGKIGYLSLPEEDMYQMLLNDNIVYSNHYHDNDETDLRIVVVDKKSLQKIDNFSWWQSGEMVYGYGRRK